MALVTLGVIKNRINRFSLSYYSLITQIIIINLITAFIGFIFVVFFNFFLLNNNKNIQIKIDLINKQIDDITNFLENNAIFKIPQFDEESGEIKFFSELQLDPYASQLYLENKYLNQDNEIKIYNSDLVKYVDTKDLYVADAVIEVEIDTNYKKLNLFHQYKESYEAAFNMFQQYFDRKKMQTTIEPAKNDIDLVIETIQKNTKVSKIFTYENDFLSFNLSNPLVLHGNIFGVVLVKGLLSQKSSEASLISFNLFNLYIIIIFIMFLLSIIFTRSIINPIKILSYITKIEQNKFNTFQGKLNYPVRNDEIGGLSNNIKNMSKELRSRINELEMFSADVAHELKNPLSSLKTSNELLAENKVKSEDRKLLFSNIIKDLNHMNRLISDISNYTRTQAEVDKQKFDELELIEFINNLKSSFSQNKKKIKILFDSNHQKIIVHANINKLAQVLINLIENAISFSPKESSILIQQIITNNQVVIYVMDQGCGINKNLKNKIFERFYTDRKNTSNYHTGLGLSISKKIMESFDGSLELNRNLIHDYNGACFKLCLPLKG